MSTGKIKVKKKEAFKKVKNIPHGKVIFDIKVAVKTNPLDCTSYLALCVFPCSWSLVIPATATALQWRDEVKPTRWPTIAEECSSVGLACSLSLLFSRNSGLASICWGLQKRIQKTKKPVVETSGTCYGRNLESMRSMWQFSIQPAEVCCWRFLFFFFFVIQKKSYKRILSTHQFQRKMFLCCY